MSDAPVDLAAEPDFRLGVLAVSPSACRVRRPDGEVRVEPRVMEVLVLLVRAAGRTVSRDQLIEACWGGRIVSDDAVARAVAQARTLARGLTPAPFVIDTVPKVGFRLTPGDPARAMPEPARSAAPDPADKPPVAVRRLPRWALAAGLGVLVALAAAGIGWRLLSGPVNPPVRIDVMAFQVRSSDPADQKRAEEITQAVIHVLSGVGVAISPNALPADAGETRAELRIVGVLERLPDRYEVSSQVLDARSGIVLLSGLYRRPLDAPADWARDVGGVITASLQCALEDRKQARSRVSTEALGLYLNACDAVFGDAASDERMLAATRRLVKAAPGLAQAHAMHAIGAARAAGAAERDDPARAAALHAESRAAAERALRLDPRTPKAYSGLVLNEGLFTNRLPQDWLAEERYLLKGLAVDPETPPLQNEYGYLLRVVGRIGEMIEVLHSGAGQTDPRVGLRPDPRAAQLLASKGRVAEALEELQQLETQQGAPEPRIRWTIAFWWEPPEKTLAAFDTLAAGLPQAERDCYRAYLQGLVSRKGAPARGLPPACAGADPAWRLRMLARQGDLDAAFAAWATMPEGRSPMIFYYPELKAFRADPRFWTIAREVGLARYWTASGHWPDFCAEPDLGYDCKARAAAVLRDAPAAPPRSGGR